jgi:hypothetical protein
MVMRESGFDNQSLSYETLYYWMVITVGDRIKSQFKRGATMSVDRKESIGGIEVHIPTGAIDSALKGLAPRLATLKGARVGILDNHKEFADLVLQGVADVLARDYGAEIRIWRKTYLGIPSPYAKEMAATCDAVINGVGH